MKMIKAIVRPEKVTEVLTALADKGFYAATKLSILGRGKQQGLKVGSITYDEIPKEMIMIVAEDDKANEIVDTIEKSARTAPSGTYGDGKIFILPVDKSITISSGEEKA